MRLFPAFSAVRPALIDSQSLQSPEGLTLFDFCWMLAGIQRSPRILF
jgi:hypothetical protein